MLFNTIKTVTASSVLSAIDAECKTQLERAQSFIGHDAAAREYINRNIISMPVVIDEDQVSVQTLTNTRGFEYTKEQKVNDIMWVFLLDTVLDAERMYWNHKYMNSAIAQFTGAPEELVKQWVGDYFEGMVNAGIVERQVSTLGRLRIFQVTAQVREELVTITDELKERAGMLCKPLENKPTDWTDLNTGVSEYFQYPLVTDYNVTDEITDQVLSAVNKLQRVAYVFDEFVLEWVVTQLDRTDLPKEDERLYNAITELPRNGKEFYFPVTMDWRGRMYYRGGLISPQGDKVLKAGLQYAVTEELTDAGWEGLALHVANECWDDKASLEDRCDWPNNNLDRITKIAGQEINKKNIMAVVCARAWLQAKRTGASNLICYIDGTCNGLQWAAAFTGDRSTAEAVNCTPASVADSPKDIYGIVARTAFNMADGEIAKWIKENGRNGAKNPVMITGYGASESTVVSNIAKKDANIDATKVGESYLAAIDEEAGAITTFTRQMKLRANEALKNGQTSFEWETEDGFMVSQSYRDNEDLLVRVTDELVARKQGKGELDLRKMANAISPNFTHSVDATHLRCIIRRCNYSLTAIHDSLGCHANNVINTQKLARQEFARLGVQNLLESVCTGLGATTPAKMGDYSAEEALRSPYLFS